MKPCVIEGAGMSAHHEGSGVGSHSDRDLVRIFSEELLMISLQTSGGELCRDGGLLLGKGMRGDGRPSGCAVDANGLAFLDESFPALEAPTFSLSVEHIVFVWDEKVKLSDCTVDPNGLASLDNSLPAPVAPAVSWSAKDVLIILGDEVPGEESPSTFTEDVF